MRGRARTQTGTLKAGALNATQEHQVIPENMMVLGDTGHSQVPNCEHTD